MYKGVFKNGHLDLYADQELIFSSEAPLAKLWHKTTVHILEHFFQDAGEDVAKMKTLLLQEWLSPFTPFTQNFEIDTSWLEAAINAAICKNASFLFEEYCEQLAFATWSQYMSRSGHAQVNKPLKIGPCQLGGEA